jgi:hypothetical protein
MRVAKTERNRTGGTRFDGNYKARRRRPHETWNTMAENNSINRANAFHLAAETASEFGQTKAAIAFREKLYALDPSRHEQSA